MTQPLGFGALSAHTCHQHLLSPTIPELLPSPHPTSTGQHVYGKHEEWTAGEANVPGQRERFPVPSLRTGQHETRHVGHQHQGRPGTGPGGPRLLGAPCQHPRRAQGRAATPNHGLGEREQGRGLQQGSWGSGTGKCRGRFHLNAIDNAFISICVIRETEVEMLCGRQCTRSRMSAMQVRRRCIPVIRVGKTGDPAHSQGGDM